MPIFAQLINTYYWYLKEILLMRPFKKILGESTECVIWTGLTGLLFLLMHKSVQHPKYYFVTLFS